MLAFFFSKNDKIIKDNHLSTSDDLHSLRLAHGSDLLYDFHVTSSSHLRNCLVSCIVQLDCPRSSHACNYLLLPISYFSIVRSSSLPSISMRGMSSCLATSPSLWTSSGRSNFNGHISGSFWNGHKVGKQERKIYLRESSEGSSLDDRVLQEQLQPTPFHVEFPGHVEMRLLIPDATKYESDIQTHLVFSRLLKYKWKSTKNIVSWKNGEILSYVNGVEESVRIFVVTCYKDRLN